MKNNKNKKIAKVTNNKNSKIKTLKGKIIKKIVESFLIKIRRIKD